MERSTTPQPKEKKTFDRTIAIIGLLIAVAAVIVAIWQGVIANGARRDAQEAARREAIADANKRRAENEAKEAKQRVEQERTKFCRFTESYKTLISELNSSLSRYTEKPSQETKNSVVASASALAAYVGNWRKAQDSIAAVLDGDVDQLQQAAINSDIDAIRLKADIVSRKANSQFTLLDSLLERASAAPLGSEHSTPGAPAPAPAKAEIVVKGGITCDCNHTQAPNIGGAAAAQCLASEQNLKTIAADGRLKLQIENGKIVSSSVYLCDSVTQGPAAWPTIGAPAKSP